jgi:hypothetical protein
MHEDSPHRTRHVKLPGGRQIEVVYLDSAGEQLEQTAQTAQTGSEADAHATQTRSDTPVDAKMAQVSGDTPTDAHAARVSGDTSIAPRPWAGDSSSSTTPDGALHVCPRCAGELVHPLDWVEESPGRWRILMRCPDCDALREGVFGQALVELLDEELDKATGALLSDLRQLTHANMIEEIEVFSRALELDLIGPNDF